MYGFNLPEDEGEARRSLSDVLAQLDQLQKCPGWEEFMRHVAALQVEAEKGMAGATTGDVALKASTAWVVLKEIQSIVPKATQNVTAQLKAFQAGRMR